jgi:hypothetical protein
MNDAQRIALGVLGTASAWTLDQFAKLAAILASLATAAFMVASLVEKIRNLRKK